MNFISKSRECIPLSSVNKRSEDNGKTRLENVRSIYNDLLKMLRAFFQYIFHRGFFSSFSLAFNSFREWLWFVSHRKSSINLISSIENNLENKEHSTFYVPTPIIPFFKLMKTLNLPKTAVFVDYGAGKGRAMILAAECGRFCKIKGLEFSPSLYNSARENIQNYINKSGKNLFNLIYANVINYKVKAEDNFFYFFHPFNETILSQCLENIYLSLKKHPRKVFLVYQSNCKNNTDHITSNGIFHLLKTFVSFGSRFYVYESKTLEHIGTKR